MDAETQQNHLKAYGITYWQLKKEIKVQWLLNYRGGSFLFPDSEALRKECQIRGVSFEVLSDQKTGEILDEINSPSRNMEAVLWKKHLKLQSIHRRETDRGMMLSPWYSLTPKFLMKLFMTKKC